MHTKTAPQHPATAKSLPLALESERVLSRYQTAQFLNVSVPTLDRLRRAIQFPKPIQVSDRRVGWKASDVLAYLAVRQGTA
jgi:predicted DNA-binding transcriptional regulator AlpA